MAWTLLYRRLPPCCCDGRGDEVPMEILRDPLCDYEVGRASDVRRPGLGSPPSRDVRELIQLVGMLLQDEGNRRVIARVVEAETGRGSEGEELRDVFARLVACGRLLLRERALLDAYPLPDPYAEPSMPLATMSADEPLPVSARTIGLEIEVVDQGGGRYAGARFVLVAADGRTRDIVLDDEATWRGDDLPEGAFIIEPLSPLTLGRDEYVRPRSSAVTPTADDLTLGRRGRDAVTLRQGGKHRLVVLQPAPSPVRAFPAASFSLGSSFPTPAVVPGLSYASEAAQHDPRQRFGVFGHCDVSGSDATNKALSDRRAQAVLSLLTADLALFDRVAEQDAWGLDAYQAMLRALGCNPGAIDGQSGAMTQAAIRAFREEYNEGTFHASGVRTRQHADLAPGDDLDEPTKAAIRDAYHGHHCVRIAKERFVGPRAAGCGEFNPRGTDDRVDRRVTLVLYGDDVPLPHEFPCVEGDESACTLDDRDTRRCRFYREHVDERPREDVETPFWDFQWLRTPGGAAHLSALTVLPDTDDAEFWVLLWTGSRPVSESGAGRARLEGQLELAVVPGLIRSGVAYSLWRPPEGYDPFDPREWFRRPEELRRDLWLPRYEPPGFAVHSQGYWGTSGPPAYVHRRVYQAPTASGPVISLRDDGRLLLNLDSSASSEDEASHRILNLLGPEPHYPKGAASP